MWGLDRLSSGELSAVRNRLRHGPCALLTHAAAVDRRGLSVLQVLDGLGIRPDVVFSPEHGFQGVAQAEEAVASSEPLSGGLRVKSLYGASKESLSPGGEDLDGISTLVVDLVDVGSRYYTYVWTALLAARAAWARGIHTVVLDRPNPIGGVPDTVEGKPQAEGFHSFVGLESVPIRHGLSIGELLAWCADRDGHQLGREGALSVVGCVGWERQRSALGWSRPFIPPSPNMPTVETALLYPGGCLVEGTNLSEGRGTAFPFRVVGAPFLDGEALTKSLIDLDLPGVMVRPTAFRPTFEKHTGQVCRGVMLHVTAERVFRPVQTYLSLLYLARLQNPESFQFLDRVYEFESDIPAFDLLCGTDAIRRSLLAAAPLDEVTQALCAVSDEDRELIAKAEALLQLAQA